MKTSAEIVEVIDANMKRYAASRDAFWTEGAKTLAAIAAGKINALRELRIEITSN